MTPRRWRLMIIALAATALAAAVVYALREKPWLAWRHAEVEPPAPALDTLAPAVAGRVRDRTEAVREAPYSAEAWGRLGDVYFVHEMFPEARACYARAEGLDPDDFRWPYFIGLSDLLGDTHAALASFERAYALKSDYPPLLIHLGRLHVANEAFARARPLFERALELNPGIVRGRLDLATVALAENRPEEAIAHVEAARALAPDASATADPEVWWLLSEAHRRLGDLEQASIFAARAAGTTRSLVRIPDPLRDEAGWREGASIDWRRARSDEYRRSGEIDRVIREWHEAVSDDPTSALAHAFLGEALASAGRRDEATRALESALHLDPTLAWPKSVLGSLLVGTGGDDERGLALVRAAVAEDPANSGTAFNLARTLARAGRNDEAERAWVDAVRAHPGHAAGVLERTESLLAEQRFDEATAILHVALDHTPANIPIRLRLAWALDHQERTDEAIAILREGLVVVPDEGHIAHDLAWLLATTARDDLRNGAEAVALLEPHSRAANDADPFILDTLAAACAEAGDFEAARRYSARAIGIVTAVPQRDAALEALLAALREHHADFEMGRAIR